MEASPPRTSFTAGTCASERGRDHYGPSNATAVRAPPQHQNTHHEPRSTSATNTRLCGHGGRQHDKGGNSGCGASPLLRATKTNFSCLDTTEYCPAEVAALVHLDSTDDDDAV
ncbi:hypothetical protein PIB30_038516 [Stylosanthes scabra]|uniref:Uncharacterized protein n=1 Tax=Stylosanthes scabra TaxID=79078 RepID=A0ABU6UH74_9FABA|nr:hypothetical protein [Stylosanthes scabra]